MPFLGTSISSYVSNLIFFPFPDFNAPKFYLELKDNTIKRWNIVVSTSFSISILFFIGIAAMGFATFGGASNGLILNNYSTKDSLMGFSRVAVAFALVFT